MATIKNKVQIVMTDGTVIDRQISLPIPSIRDCYALGRECPYIADDGYIAEGVVSSLTINSITG